MAFTEQVQQKAQTTGPQIWEQLAGGAQGLSGAPLEVHTDTRIYTLTQTDLCCACACAQILTFPHSRPRTVVHSLFQVLIPELRPFGPWFIK